VICSLIAKDPVVGVLGRRHAYRLYFTLDQFP
jgi:hypothetical protein